jgi:hypothetical protein
MKKSRRKTVALSEALHQRLNTYALTATTAGVSVLALARASEAKIVYTPAHVTIGANGSYKLDLNHDGNIDFTIKNVATCASDQCFYDLLQEPAAGNSGMNDFKGYVLASALKPGSRIGPGKHFSDQTAVMAGVISAIGYVFGQWVNVQRRFLGLRFKINGQTHYGWARLNVRVVLSPHPAITAVLTGYAYEDVPDKPIVAGQTKGLDDDSPEELSANPMPTPKPATLGALAMGAPGLSIWRREKSISPAQ